MALVSFLPPVAVPIPHEPGNRFVFRKPRGEVIREARKIAESDGRKSVRDFGAEIFKALREDGDDDRLARRAKRLAAEQEYDPDQFDRLTLLRASIVDWIGPAYEDPETHEPIAVSETGIADLDEETARWAHHYIVDLIKPSTTKEADKSAPAAAAPGA